MYLDENMLAQCQPGTNKSFPELGVQSVKGYLKKSKFGDGGLLKVGQGQGSVLVTIPPKNRQGVPCHPEISRLVAPLAPFGEPGAQDVRVEISGDNVRLAVGFNNERQKPNYRLWVPGDAQVQEGGSWQGQGQGPPPAQGQPHSPSQGASGEHVRHGAEIGNAKHCAALFLANVLQGADAQVAVDAFKLHFGPVMDHVLSVRPSEETAEQSPQNQGTPAPVPHGQGSPAQQQENTEDDLPF